MLFLHESEEDLQFHEVLRVIEQLVDVFDIADTEEFFLVETLVPLVQTAEHDDQV